MINLKFTASAQDAQEDWQLKMIFITLALRPVPHAEVVYIQIHAVSGRNPLSQKTPPFLYFVIFHKGELFVKT